MVAELDVKRKCRLCGREFDGHISSLYCDECKVVACPVCGKRMKLSPVQMTRYVKRGWVTCSCRCGQAWRDSAHGLLRKDG